jgi:hypothetical protein
LEVREGRPFAPGIVELETPETLTTQLEHTRATVLAAASAGARAAWWTILADEGTTKPWREM